jgi:hypothetical protein
VVRQKDSRHSFAAQFKMKFLIVLDRELFNTAIFSRCKSNHDQSAGESKINFISLGFLQRSRENGTWILSSKDIGM